ncbi:MAG: hypothetical protein LBU65_08435 [Planctomycetaceae bacterium]|jgi:hypothetical protein|nr:hypothetical protein [Planctomycetaceae bacterium]
MSTIAMREFIKSEIDFLPEDSLLAVQDFVCQKLHVPNTETLAAIQETEDIIAGKIERKSYKTAAELFAAIRSGKN